MTPMPASGREPAPVVHPGPTASPRSDDDAQPVTTTRATVTRRSLLVLSATVALSACSTAQPIARSSTTRSPDENTSSSPPPQASPSSRPADPTPSPGITIGRTTEIGHGPRTVQSVALTFHGAGDPRIASQVLVAVEQAGAAATVLAVGTWLQAYPAMGDRVLRGGHELGNHTLHHKPMRLMDEATAYAEILGGQQQVHKHVTTPTWFRPSGTPHATPAILAAAERAGYASSLAYDVDPADYTDPGPAVVVSRVLSQARAGSIVSLHLGHQGTVAAMPRILAGLHRRGLSVVTVSHLLTGVAP